jgi:hypothetical protein
MSARRFPIRRALCALAASALLAGCAVEPAPAYYDGPVYSASIAYDWPHWYGESPLVDRWNSGRVVGVPVRSAEHSEHHNLGRHA